MIKLKQLFSKHISLVRTCLISALTLLPLLVHATPIALPTSSILIADKDPDFLQSDPFQSQRALYKQAEKALQSRHYKRFHSLKRQLTNYPLRPYLEYKDLKRQLGQLNSQTINNFFTEHSDSLLAPRLRRKLIKYYARTKRWQDLIGIYQPQRNISLQCKYLNALIQTGQKALAFEQVPEIWLSGRSQPKACDTVFNKWTAAGFQTHDLTWKRIALAMAKGNTSLTKYLAKSLSASDRRLANKWIKLHRQPQKAMHTQLHPGHRMTTKILTHAIKRLSRKDVDKGSKLWQHLSSRHLFSETETQTVYRDIGLIMARQHHSDAHLWLDKISDKYHDNYSREWQIRTAIRVTNWPLVIESIERLPTKKQANLRWQYWWAHAHEQLGHNLESEGIFHYLATRRSYYGFLAADHLGLPYAFEDQPITISNMEISSIAHFPAALRAKELFKLDKNLDARREWYSLITTMNERQKLVASKLAQQWQWHNQAIYTMGRTDYRNDIQLRFPLPMKNKVESWSARQNIEPALTYAIIRRESAFNQEARSHVGAMGLMQLLPGTARFIAKNMRVRYRGKYSLLSADTNIKLGTGYLNHVLKKLDNQYVLATAAYNAGPHRVQSWLPESESMTATQWIETIPFTETREYVSNVLAYTIIYQHLLNDNYTRLSSNMPSVPARNPPPESATINKIVMN